MSEENKPFWLVWNPLRNPAQHRHETEASAWTEAERLAVKHPDDHFFVLRSVGKAWAVATCCKITHEEVSQGVPW